MTCKECQRLVPDYLSDHLKAKELESFITHVRSCPDCYEELETYFIINLATQVLDDSAELSYDIKGMLQQDLAEKEDLLHKKRRRVIILAVLILVFFAADIVLTLHLLGVL